MRIDGTTDPEVLNGTADDDTISGNFGNDTMDGGGGVDTVDFAYSNPANLGGGPAEQTWTIRLENDDTGSAIRRGGGSTLEIDTLSNFSNVVGSGWDDSIRVFGGDHNVRGGTGDDEISIGDAAGLLVLDGSSGVNTLSAVIDYAPTVVFDMVAGEIQDGSGPLDTFVNFRNLIVGNGVNVVGDSADNLIQVVDFGDESGENSMTGGAGNDTIESGDDDDTLLGQSGDDSLMGQDGDDSIVGGSGDDRIEGGSGEDTLIGSAGRDVVLGGSGDDVYRFNFATSDQDTIAETSGGGTDSIILSVLDARDVDFRRSSDLLVIEDADTPGKIIIEDHYSGIPTERIEFFEAAGETFFLKNTNAGTSTDDIIVGRLADDVIDGAGGEDLLFGGGGEDTLTGGSGDDVVRGGVGRDTYVFSFATSDEDIIAETGGQGWDTLRITDLASDEISYRRSGELLVMESTETDGKIIIRDHFSGIATERVEQIETTDGVHFFKTGLVGTDTSDLLVGTSGAQTIRGEGGADIIVGSGNKDLLFGGAGADLFVYSDASDSGLTSNTRDTIYDFGGNDRISLLAFDTDTGAAGDQGFTFQGTGAHSGAGSLRYGTQNGNTLIGGDLDGDGADDFSILLAGDITLNAGDFIL